MSVFEEVKARVNLIDVARTYGFNPNRAGFICCPFHHEKTPSLKFNTNGRWHCFGCGAGGDAIDFVAQLFQTSKWAALDRLNSDFFLGLDLHRKATPEEVKAARQRQETDEVYKQFERWRGEMIADLNSVYRVAHFALKKMGSWNNLTDVEISAIQRQAQAEYLSDTLSNGSAQDQVDIFKDRKAVEKWTGQILNNLPQRSRTA